MFSKRKNVTHLGCQWKLATSTLCHMRAVHLHCRFFGCFILWPLIQCRSQRKTSPKGILTAIIAPKEPPRLCWISMSSNLLLAVSASSRSTTSFRFFSTIWALSIASRLALSSSRAFESWISLDLDSFRACLRSSSSCLRYFNGQTHQRDTMEVRVPLLPHLPLSLSLP